MLSNVRLYAEKNVSEQVKKNQKGTIDKIKVEVGWLYIEKI